MASGTVWCPSTRPSAPMERCYLVTDHAGRHQLGSVAWDDHGAEVRLTVEDPEIDPDSYHAGYQASLADRPTLAVQLARYLETRQHTLSTAHLTGFEQIIAEAKYVLGEAQELLDAVEGAARLWERVGDNDRARLLRGIRKEIADVALADTTLAGMLSDMTLPGGYRVGTVTVEDCIAEKTEIDRGRG